jgi:PleD family two-component response regulator
VTVSIGSTSLHLENDSLPKMLARADRARYTAKESGRNRVCIQA